MKKLEQTVPNLRFKGFTDDWEQRKLGEISKRVRNNDGRMNLPLLTISARYGWMTQQSRFSASIAGREKKNYTLLKKHQLSYNHGNSKVANYGTVYELTDYDEALVPKVYHSFSLTSENSSKFIESYFHTKKLDAQLRKFIASTARMDGLLNISFDDFMKVKLFAPERCEQSKISRIINLIEKLITLQQRKLDLLKQLKKGFLQKMFADQDRKQPVLRFKGFHDDWEQRKLGEVAKINPKSVIPDSFWYADLGSVVGTELIKIRKMKKNNSPSRAQRVAENGDIFYQTVRPYQKNNYLFELSNNDYVFSTGYAQIRPIINARFLFSYIQRQNFVNKVLKRSTGTSYPAVSGKDLSNININICKSANEQVAVGKITTLLDTLITLQQQKLAKYQSIKKSLLQQMFI